KSVDEVGLNTAAVHALWTLHGLGLLDDPDQAVFDRVTRALSHPAAGVRKAAATVLPATPASFNALVKSKSLYDSDLNTRLAVFNRLVDYPASGDVAKELWAATKDQQNNEDKWLNRVLF